MALYHSVTWQEGNFERTACVLSFTSKAARAAYRSDQRVQQIDSKFKAKLLREGRAQVLLLWDAAEPTKFVRA